MNRFKTIEKIAAEIGLLINSSRDADLLSAYRLLHSRITDPKTFVTFVGETSSGKSFLINGLVKLHILPYSVKPTTGTVVQLQFTETENVLYYAINRDASIEELIADQFIRLAKKPDGDLLRLYAELPIVGEKFGGLNLFDTPGYNSVITEHEDVLREFVPQSDVVIFVVTYKGGFRSSDQEFMTLIGKLLDEDKNLPVIVVINMCAPGMDFNDKRIIEIRKHAEDSLHRLVILYLVSKATDRDDGQKELPDTEILSKEISRISNSSERRNIIAQKTTSLLLQIIEKLILEYESIIITSRLSEGEISELELEQCEIKEKLKCSYEIVDKFIKRLDDTIPKLINNGTRKLLTEINDEIYNSGKYLEAEPCKSFISGHKVKFGITNIIGDVEGYICEVFRQMDDELEEMAAGIVHHLNNKVKNIKSPDLAELITNLSLRIGGQITKNVTATIIKGLGGVGGTAAGAGNLVKMVVSRTGRIFGKTFGREVYTKIGKIFTQKMLTRLNIEIAILADAISFVWDAHKWQGELVKEVTEKINSWQKEVLDELKIDLTGYSLTHKNLLEEIYKGFDEEILKDISAIRKKRDNSEKTKIRLLITQLNECKIQLESI